MLDDLNVIAQRDPQDALGFAAQQPQQLKHDFGLAQQDIEGEIQNVVYAGMGGSSLVAEFVNTFPGLKVPFVICKDYDLPAFANKNTLVICASYSGNTEETLSALSQAEEKGAHIVIIAYNGKLTEFAKQKNYPLASVPHCTQPRTGVFYMYRAVAEIFVAAKLAEPEVIQQLEAVVSPLEQAITGWVADVPEQENYAKQLAQQMVGKTPIIYAGSRMYGAAFKWKINVNENAKNTAWSSPLPEFNHNEFIGWSSHPVEKPFAVIDLISSFEHPRTIKRFEVSDRLLSGMRPKSITVEAKGETIVEQLLYLVLLSDYATMYLGFLNGVNPTPVELVEKFKKELS
jgi:glucose/mannose-6-phosphate isomerase